MTRVGSNLGNNRLLVLRRRRSTFSVLRCSLAQMSVWLRLYDPQEQSIQPQYHLSALPSNLPVSHHSSASTSCTEASDVGGSFLMLSRYPNAFACRIPITSAIFSSLPTTHVRITSDTTSVHAATNSGHSRRFPPAARGGCAWGVVAFAAPSCRPWMWSSR